MRTLTFLICISLLIWRTNSQALFTFSTIFYDYIQTPLGPVRGNCVNFNGSPVKRYLGIPYAKPPLGELRFQKTQPVEPWNHVLIADKMPPACMQYSKYPWPWYDSEPGKSEDCLYLNIWVPQSQIRGIRKPVLFWIHGGGFVSGSSRKPIFDGVALAAEGDVIVVTINFRLGAFGFFTSYTNAAPGNVGIYDMVEALKWVNKNIAAFGGDPTKVTIAGESGGAVATGLLAVSPLADGLFSKIIVESGSAANLLAENNTVNLDNGQRLAAALGCADQYTTIFNNPEKVVRCVQKKDPWLISKTISSQYSASSISFYPNYGDEILPSNPRVAIATGNFQNVDILIGHNRDEGDFLIATAIPNVFGFFGEKSPKINKTLGKDLIGEGFLRDFPAKDAVVKHYLGNIVEGDYYQIRKQVCTAVGDFIVQCPTGYFAESYSRAGNKVYYYLFDQRPSTAPWASWMGPTHFDEVQYVFGRPLDNPRLYRREEIKLSRNMIKIWSNFVKYGNPGDANWPLFSRENPLSKQLGPGTVKIVRSVHSENCDFFRPYFGFF